VGIEKIFDGSWPSQEISTLDPIFIAKDVIGGDC